MLATHSTSALQSVAVQGTRCDSLNHAGGHWEGMGSAGRAGIHFSLIVTLCLRSWEWWQCSMTETLQAGIGVPYGENELNC